MSKSIHRVLDATGWDEMGNGARQRQTIVYDDDLSFC